MNIVGLDIGKRKAQVCVTREDGTIIEERSIVQRPEELSAFFAKYPGSRILLEASTSAEWVARHLESLGHDVIIADPRFRLMYAAGDKKIKTDRRDARALAVALRVNAFRPAHRKSDEARALSLKVKLRAGLVRARTRLIQQVRAACEYEGVIIPQCNTRYFVDTARETRMPDDLTSVLEPTMLQIASVQEAVEVIDAEIEALGENDATVARLKSVRGIGALTATMFRATLDDVERFESAKEMTSYLGLVPSQNSSGDAKNRLGRITKTGDGLLRSYLVEAAHLIMSKRTADSPLKRWALQVAARRGKKKAVVALARKLARILFAMWRDGSDFDASKTNALVAAQLDERRAEEAPTS
jgi:transposase